ncbi:hypothetical protein D3C78_406300 [compost metagenome]
MWKAFSTRRPRPSATWCTPGRARPAPSSIRCSAMTRNPGAPIPRRPMASSLTSNSNGLRCTGCWKPMPMPITCPPPPTCASAWAAGSVPAKRSVMCRRCSGASTTFPRTTAPSMASSITCSRPTKPSPSANCAPARCTCPGIRRRIWRSRSKNGWYSSATPCSRRMSAPPAATSREAAPPSCIARSAACSPCRERPACSCATTTRRPGASRLPSARWPSSARRTFTCMMEWARGTSLPCATSATRSSTCPTCCCPRSR